MASKSKLNSTQKFRSPAMEQSRNPVSALQSKYQGSHGVLPPNTIAQTRAGSIKKLQGTQELKSERPSSEFLTGSLAKRSSRQEGSMQHSSSQMINKMVCGSPVMINSYSNLYKQQREHSRGPLDTSGSQLRPEKENSGAHTQSSRNFG